MKNPTIQTTAGWSEVTIIGDCEFSDFYEIAELMEKDFNVKFKTKISDFDSLYWDFDYKQSVLTIHYNIYLGISVFPGKFKDASEEDNQNVVEFGTLLFKKLNP